MGVQLQVEIVCVLQALGHIRVITVELPRVAPCLPVDLSLQKRRVAPAEFLLEQRRRCVQHVRNEDDGKSIEPLSCKGEQAQGAGHLHARIHTFTHARMHACEHASMHARTLT